jgi:hypothetical protein
MFNHIQLIQMKEGWIFLEKILSIEEILILLNLKNKRIKLKTNELYQNKKSAATLSLSKLYNNNEYPFHNDGVQYPFPPKYIILQNKTSNSYKTKTLLIDGLKLSQSNLNLFYNSVFTIKGNNGFTERTTIVNSSKLNDEKIIRFNPVIMKSNISNKKGLVEDCIKNYKDVIEIEWQPNSTLIIDNWRYLHSRTKNKDLNIKRELIRTEIYTNE